MTAGEVAREEVAFQQVLSRFQQVAQAVVRPLVVMNHLETCVVRTKLETTNIITHFEKTSFCSKRGIKTSVSYLSSQSDLLPVIRTAANKFHRQKFFHCYTFISIVTQDDKK